MRSMSRSENPEAESRAARLAAALRDNLRRRKMQARARTDSAGPADGADAAAAAAERGIEGERSED